MVPSVFSTVPYAPQPDKTDAKNRFSFTCYNTLFLFNEQVQDKSVQLPAAVLFSEH